MGFDGTVCCQAASAYPDDVDKAVDEILVAEAQTLNHGQSRPIVSSDNAMKLTVEGCADKLDDYEEEKGNLTMPRMTSQEAFKLKVNDKIDHRDQLGRFASATVTDKRGSKLKIHYDGWSQKWDVWSDWKQEIHLFAARGSISERPAHRMSHLKKGDYGDVNPSIRHSGWKAAEIRYL